MNYKILIIIISIFFLTGCEQNNVDKKIFNQQLFDKYTNTGFALIYDENLKIKKIDERSLNIFHKSLKNRSFVKITNPINNKSLIAEIKSNKVEFSNFYNSVISTRIAEILDLDLKEPFIEIVLISKDSTFVAKKAKTFEEEREVAEKAPIDGIKISNISTDNQNKNKNIPNKKFSYSIKVADFYYKKTAQLMIDRIKTETLLDNIKILQESNILKI